MVQKSFFGCKTGEFSSATTCFQDGFLLTLIYECNILKCLDIMHFFSLKGSPWFRYISGFDR